MSFHFGVMVSSYEQRITFDEEMMMQQTLFDVWCPQVGDAFIVKSEHKNDAGEVLFVRRRAAIIVFVQVGVCVHAVYGSPGATHCFKFDWNGKDLHDCKHPWNVEEYLFRACCSDEDDNVTS